MIMSPVNLPPLRAETNNRSDAQYSSSNTSTEAAEGHSQEATTSNLSQRHSADGRSSRTTRRATSHSNHFQTTCSFTTDDPPNYASATRQKLVSRREEEGHEALPDYRATVTAEGKFQMQIESVSPLHATSDETDWREVYLILRGTLLTIYRLKNNGPGKVLRKYSLQHAEVGLAPDSEHIVLLPRTRWARMIPRSARQRAWQKDPEIFTDVRQHVLRLRAELDQFVLAHASEECVLSLIGALSAAIDIAPPLDERNIPKQCTVPRRRRRTTSTRTVPSDLTDPTVVAEQERLLREMYPAFAERREQPLTTQSLDADDTASVEPPEIVIEAVETPAVEEDELDLAVIREDFVVPTPSTRPHSSSSDLNLLRPSMTRYTTSTSVISVQSADLMPYAPVAANSNFNEDTGKWHPATTRTPAQVQRYIRRCVPILLADQPRASDIVLFHDRRLRVNWRCTNLDDWELLPPSYKSHQFGEISEANIAVPNAANLSAAEETTLSETAPNPPASRGNNDDQILCVSTPAADNDSFPNSGTIFNPSKELCGVKILLTNSKDPTDPTTPSLTANTTAVVSAPLPPLSAPQKSAILKERQQRHAEVHSIVFCF